MNTSTINSTPHTFEAFNAVKAHASMLSLEEERTVTLEEAFENITEEGCYQVGGFSSYLSAPAGKWYSNSTPAQRILWDNLREFTHEALKSNLGPDADTENILGDEVDWEGLIHHTGCMAAWDELTQEELQLDDETYAWGQEVLTAFKAGTPGEWS